MKQASICGKKLTVPASSQLLRSIVLSLKAVLWLHFLENHAPTVILRLLKFFVSSRVSGAHLKVIFLPISMRTMGVLERMQILFLVLFISLILLLAVMPLPSNRMFKRFLGRCVY